MKKIFFAWLPFLFLCLPVLFMSGAFAQDMGFVVEQVSTWLASLIVPYVIKYPAISLLLLFMGTCRAMFKPVFAYLEATAPQTKTDIDDKAVSFLKKCMQNKYVGFLIDLVFSIKTKVEPKK